MDESPYLTWQDQADALQSIEWIWPGWLPAGFLVGLVGAQEKGKSLPALRIVATLTMGWPWPDGSAYNGPPNNVAWAEGESGQQISVERARSWSLDLSRIIVPSSEIEDFIVTDSRQWAGFADLLGRDGNALGVVDSLSGIHRRRESDAEMAQVIQPFAALARDTGRPIILTHHLTKAPRGLPDVVSLDRVRGSGVITQTMRVVWAVDTPDPNAPEHRRLRVLKSSIGLKPPALGFTIGDDGLTFTPDPPREASKSSALSDAAAFLRDVLANGPLPAKEIEKLADAEGITRATLYRAKRQLRVQSEKRGSEWFWRQPDPYDLAAQPLFTMN